MNINHFKIPGSISGLFSTGLIVTAMLLVWSSPRNASAATSAPVGGGAPLATVTGIHLVSSVRTGRTTYNYTYTINVRSGATPLYRAIASVTSSSPDTLIVNGSVNIGNLAAQASTTVGTFTIQQNRLVAFNPAALSWTFTSNPYSTGPDPLPVFGTTTYSATVVLPVGSIVPAGQLAVIDTIAQTVPVASGQFSLPAYNNGSQVAVVLSPAGNPMLLGWLDANHRTVSASTTAEVFAYFALGGALLLNDSDRAELIAEMPDAPGFQNLVQAIATAVAASADTFATANAAVSSAVTAFVSGIVALPASAAPNSIAAAAQFRLHSLVSARAGFPNLAGTGARVRPQDVTVVTPAQSGVSLVEDQPFAAHVSNATRRRAWAFVQSVSYTTAGQVTPYPNPVTDFEVAPEVGVNGGVNGTVSDIINAYFGNSNSAYTPVDSPSTGPFALPLLANSDSTTYQVTVVGPGPHNQAALYALPQNQFNEQIQISVHGFTIDAMVPFLSNVIFGTTLGSPSKPLVESLASDLQTDLLSNTTLLPGLQAKLTAGQYGDALFDVLNGFNSGGGVLDIVESDIQKAVIAAGESGGFGPNGPSGLTMALQNITKILGSVNAALQAFDTTVYTAQIASADAVDQFTLTVTPASIKMNPASATIGIGGIQAIQVLAVGGVAPPPNYSYQWSTTGNFGDLTVINPSSGVQTHQNNFCSSVANVQYVDETSAATGTQDTVSVQVYSGSACSSTKGQLLGTGKTILTYQGDTATLSPVNPTAAAGAAIPFTVAVTGPLPPGVAYQWSVAGSAGGTLTDPVSGTVGGSFKTTSASVTYTASASATAPQQDVVAVAVSDPNTTPPAMLGKASSTVSFGNPWVGYWVGSTVSTCGSYSGPQNFTITQLNATTLDFGPYAATFSGDTALVNGGEVVFTLSGNTITGYEADSCQNGTYTRQ